jgi:hypothetical protein
MPKGALDIVLSEVYNLDVVGIEGDGHNAGEAERRLAQQRKRQRGEQSGAFAAISVRIPPIGANEVVVRALPARFENGRQILVGLHACGDLSVAILRLFASLSTAHGLVSLGCCYNLLSEAFPKDAKTPSFDAASGFPTSEFGRSKRVSLGHRARMVACQALDRWPSQEGECIRVLRTHLFRFALQVVLGRIRPCLFEDGGEVVVGHLPKDCLKSGFVQYARRCMHKLAIESEISDSEIEEIYSTCEREQHRVAAFWALRAAIGPAAEGAILADRVIYLREQKCCHVKVVPLFDVVRSPRCFAIVAVKNKE